MPLRPGSRLGPYEVVALLGAGGMGEVYTARDTRLARKVALKVVSPAFALDAARLARFEREARAAAALSHPNICAVFDVGNQDGTPFIVSELLEGESLRAACASGPLPVRRAVEYAVQIARGLAAAHDRGIVHRDLKPDNVFVTTDGLVKLVDFGVAKLASDSAAEAATRLETRPPATGDGVVVGTPGYMAPEQLRGQPADARSDIFGLGAVLFEMLAGQRPFRGNTAADTAAAILTLDPPPLPADRVVPPMLDRIVHRCLAKAPRDRFQTADDLAFALEAVSAPSTVTDATAVPPAARGKRWLPPVVAAIAMLVVVLAGAPLVLPPGLDLSAYRFVPFEIESQMSGAPAWSPDGRSIAYNQTIDGHDQLFVRALGSDAAVQLTQGIGASAPGGGPFWWPDSSRIGYVADDGAVWSIGAAGGMPERLQTGVNVAATLSPDGRTLALWRQVQGSDHIDSSVWLASPPDAQPRPYEPRPFAVRGPIGPDSLAFSPNGRELLLSQGTEDGAAAVWVLPTPDGAGASPRRLAVKGIATRAAPRFAWMPDSRRAVMSMASAAARKGGLFMVDTVTGNATLLTSGLTPQNTPSVSPDGERVAFTSGEGDDDAMEIPLDGSPLVPLLATTSNESAAAWVPGGREFVYVTDKSGADQLRVRNPTTGADRLIVNVETIGAGGAIGAPVVSGDGQRVAYYVVGAGGTVKTWISPIGGGVPLKLEENGVIEVAPEWSPDSTRIACLRQNANGAFTLSVVRLGSTNPPTVIDAGPQVDQIAGVPAWSPDGTWIAYPTTDDVRLVAPDGALRRVLAIHGASAVAWSSDSQSVYAAVRTPDAVWSIHAVGLRSGTDRVITRLPWKQQLDTRLSPGLRLTLNAEHSRLLSTVAEPHLEIWILDHFAPRRWTDWFRRPH